MEVILIIGNQNSLTFIINLLLLMQNQIRIKYILQANELRNYRIECKDILITDVIDVYKRYRKNCIFVDLDKIEESSDYKEKIERDIKEHNQNNIIIKDMLNLGFNFKYMGTKYIEEIIKYLVNSKDRNMMMNLEKNVYINLAKKYNTSINNIKVNMSKATDIAYTVQKESIIQNYFKTSVKMTPKMVITTIINKNNLL